MTAYEIRNLVKSYPGQDRPANCGISLEIEEGEVFGLLGSNGAGKSTLIRQLVNLARPTSGEILLFGVPIEADPLRVPLHVGYMPQDVRALGSLRVDQVLFYTACLRGKSPGAAREEREHLLALWDLYALRHRVITQLSTGQRRLVALATAMAAAPRILILDEPTNDLDPLRRQQVWNRLRSLASEQGTTIVLVTHDAIEAERVIDRVGIMKSGELVKIGRPAVLKRDLDQRVWLEITFPPGQAPALPSAIAPQQLSPGRWLLRIDRSHLPELLNFIEVADLDFKMHSATLEDLYLRYAIE
jgi:ABC-type multidrug transport system ATPase subunit